MRVEHRQVMWEVFERYQASLVDADVCDFNDLLVSARDVLRSGAVRLPFDAVVVDEVQDFNLVGLQLLHAIVGDAPNGLLLIGDGQQSVYPGGFTLTEAGISVAGRAHVFTMNYRNTRQILEHALATVAGDAFDDLETLALPGGREVVVTRTGEPPQVVHTQDRRSLDQALVAHLLRANLDLEVRFGDMAVLASSRREVDRLAHLLSRERIGTVRLDEYDGQPSDLVRLGTYKRAKGLEFKCVFLPDLRVGDPRPWLGESVEAYEERAARLRREEFVAMTRARDQLWLGYLTQ
jgi:superfamily I DNA/RNA helicase